MKLALLSDVHANADALRAVLADLPPVDAIVCCGDLIGYYDSPDEVCAILREQRAYVIRGNHDAYVAGALPYDAQREEVYRVAWTREALSAAHLSWLATLPTGLTFAVGGRVLQVRHATPWDEESYLYPDSQDGLARLELAPNEMLAVGHTHRAGTVVVNGGGLLVNPGSVGQPRDYLPGASYAVVDVDRGTVALHRASYDIPALQARLRDRGWARPAIEILSRRGSTHG